MLNTATLAKKNGKNMPSKKILSIHTKKNWFMAVYMVCVGALLLAISINLFDYNEGDWIANTIFATLFIFGILAFCTFLLFIFSKEKVLVFTITNKYLTMSEDSDHDDKDFNKSVPLKEITKFYQKTKIRWGGLGTYVDGLFYMDNNHHTRLFLDLTGEARIPAASVEKIVQFVSDNKKIT